MTERSAAPMVVWFRDDLRLHDHPALVDAAAGGGPVIPLYILEPGGEGGRAWRWWRQRSLESLDAGLARLGSRLVLARGRPAEAVPRLAALVGAGSVVWNRRWSAAGRAADTAVAAALAKAGVAHRDHPADLLAEPDTLRTTEGNPYRVFTPFWRRLQRTAPPEPRPAPVSLPAPADWPAGPAPEDLGWTGTGDGEFEPGRHWCPGEDGAARRWEEFGEGSLEDYDEQRNRPDLPGTSRLSPHLGHGEISIRSLWQGAAGPAGEAWRRQLVWREFAHHLLHHFPDTVTTPFNPAFTAFPWAPSELYLDAWRSGGTGYPFVDAGMRQLAATGWMHNRLRMITASFLVKHLLVPWQDGAAWFRDRLLDHDRAANVFGWQWTAGCGADAAPWFRIFHPVIQGKRHDPDGVFIRRWVPELADLPRRWVHAPWLVPPERLAAAGLELGRDYPRPLVDHEEARLRAMAAWQEIRRR